jgi:hypothetical protein
VAVSHARRITRLMELPEGRETRMNALEAGQQLATDGCVTHVAVPEDSPRHSDRSLRVVGGFADAPLALRIPDVPGDGCSCRPLESAHPGRIPSKNVLTGQRFGLLSDRVTGCDPLETTENPLFQGQSLQGGVSGAVPGQGAE